MAPPIPLPPVRTQNEYRCIQVSGPSTTLRTNSHSGSVRTAQTPLRNRELCYLHIVLTYVQPACWCNDILTGRYQTWTSRPATEWNRLLILREATRLAPDPDRPFRHTAGTACWSSVSKPDWRRSYPGLDQRPATELDRLLVVREPT